jgi:hypothetical protein
MELIINGDKVDFTLENEKNYAEVLSGVKKWADSNRMAIVSWQINGKSSDANPTDITIAPKDVLEINLEDKVQERKSEISLLGEFFGLLESAIMQGKDDLLAELQGEYRILSPNLPYLLLEEGQSENFRLSTILDQYILNRPFPPEGEKEKVELLLFIKQLLGRVELYAKEIQNPEIGLEIHFRVLSDNWAELESIPSLFQAGEDKKALDKLMVLLSSLDGIFRMASLLGEQSLEDKKSLILEVKDFLGEMSEAIENQDFVLVGDLVEYEILPRLKTLLGEEKD